MNKETDQDLLAEIIRFRREFHRYPELSGQERYTSEKVVEILTQIGVAVQTFSDHYGVCATICGQGAGPVIAFRADMDALPITEAVTTEYSSIVPGVMHACGHDGHTAILLGLAKLLVAHRAEFAGTVKLIFQPAEEASPVGGAQLLIRDGVLENPKVEAIFGLHLWPSLLCGEIGIKEGPLMAASDRFSITLLGESTHVGTPHKGVDAIMMMAEVLQGLNNVMNRQINPLDVATLSIGKVTGGDRYNIVASKVVLEGTVRTFAEDVRRVIPEHMERLIQGIAEGHGGHAVLDYQAGYPVLNNWPDPTQLVIEAAREVLVEKSIIEDIEPNLGAEDFSRYLERVPGAFFWLGSSKPGQQWHPLHNQEFDIDEQALLIGVQTLFHIACKALKFYCNK